LRQNAVIRPEVQPGSGVEKSLQVIVILRCEPLGEPRRMAAAHGLAAILRDASLRDAPQDDGGDFRAKLYFAGTASGFFF
jgi:hypothetical protein